jgi:integrase
MAVARITKREVDQLAKGQIVWDTEVKGLGVRCQTTEAKHYILRFPIPAQGKTRQRIMSLGRHGSPLTPELARKEARRLLGQVASGIDPLAEKKKQREPKPEGLTFNDAVEAYISAKLSEWKPGTAKQVINHLRTLAKPLHPLALAEINRQKVAELLRAIQTNSGPVARNRTRTSISAMYKWLDAEGLVPEGTNPAAGTVMADEGPSRDRVLSNAELAEIWRALADDHVSDIIRLLVLTGQRRNEIAKLHWSEIDFEKALLTLPPARTKNRRTHELPLAPQAIAILQRWANGPEHSKHQHSKPEHSKHHHGPEYSKQKTKANRVANDGVVFEPVGWDLRKQKLDKAILAKRGGKPMPHWTLHDLRRTCATGLAELGVLPHVIECILNHLSGFRAGVAAIYNRNRYVDEMREALVKWANHVDAITSPAAKARALAL